MTIVQPGNTIRILALLLIWYSMQRAGLPIDSTPGASPQSVLDGKVVVIDPGHGGTETGATGVAGSKEKDNTLATSLIVKEVLTEAGATVILTRETDEEPNRHSLPPGASLAQKLQQRVAIAQQAQADVFISIHNDWNANAALRGTTTYYWNSPQLATCVQDALVVGLGSRDVGIIQKNFYVIANASMPAILVELGFLSNAADEKLLGDTQYHLRAAESIRAGLIAYFTSAHQ